MSHVIKEVAGVLDITLKHATKKHAQKIGLLKGSHASIKQALKAETGERGPLWHKHVSIAVLIYNISYHASYFLSHWLLTEQSISWTHSL